MNLKNQGLKKEIPFVCMGLPLTIIKTDEKDLMGVL